MRHVVKLQETGMVTTAVMTDWFIGQHGNLLSSLPSLRETSFSRGNFSALKKGFLEEGNREGSERIAFLSDLAWSGNSLFEAFCLVFHFLSSLDHLAKKVGVQIVRHHLVHAFFQVYKKISLYVVW